MSESKKKENKKQILDGGWGWFVCLGSSLITVNYPKLLLLQFSQTNYLFLLLFTHGE